MELQVLFSIVFGCCVVVTEAIIIKEKGLDGEEVELIKKHDLPEMLKTVLPFAYTLQHHNTARPTLHQDQGFAGLPPQSAPLDAKSNNTISRCGVKDTESTRHRRKRYNVLIRWYKNLITYRVINGARTLEKSRVEALMQSAFDLWASHAGLHIQKVDTGFADIEVSFVRGEHGDGTPFDGRGGIIAHAYPPHFGVIHFDDDEIWTDNPDSSSYHMKDFFSVALHEIGHALGMLHSPLKESVMYSKYIGVIRELHPDDIAGIRALYFKNDTLMVPAPHGGIKTEIVRKTSVTKKFRYRIPITYLNL